MLPTYETDRLVLRQRTLEDMADLMAMDSDPEVTRYISGLAADFHEPDTVRDRILKTHEPGLGTWTIEYRTGAGAYAGAIALVPLDGGPEIEIGYRLPRPLWGKGIASEAVQCVLHHGFETVGLERIVAVTDMRNLASQRVLVKCGMRHAGWRDAYGDRLMLFAIERD